MSVVRYVVSRASVSPSGVASASRSESLHQFERALLAMLAARPELPAHRRGDDYEGSALSKREMLFDHGMGAGISVEAIVRAGSETIEVALRETSKGRRAAVWALLVFGILGAEVGALFWLMEDYDRTVLLLAAAVGAMPAALTEMVLRARPPTPKPQSRAILALLDAVLRERFELS